MAEKKPFLPEFLTRKKKGAEEDTEPQINRNINAPFTPTNPGINLIPQAVLDGYALQRLQTQFAKAIVILIASIIALWGVLFGLEKVNEMRVNNAEAEAQQYRSEVQALQPYADYRDSVQNKRTTIGEKMSTEVDTGAIVEEITNAGNSAGVSVSSSLTIDVLNGASEGAEATTAQTISECAAANPFATEQSIGCVSFTGSGDRENVAEFIRLLEENPNFNNAFVPSTSGGENKEFSGFVNFTGGFLTNAYSDLLAETPVEAPSGAPVAPGTIPAPAPENEEVQP